MAGDDEDARAAAETAARRSYGRLVAYLSARTRDVAGAEDALADAFAAALESWPRSGVPANPEAWLLSVARRRAIDTVRRRITSVNATDHLKLLAEERADDSSDGAVPDERLRLMFACAHPALDAGVHAPMILQTVLGFDAAAIASAFLVSPATMSQRLVRAKSRIKQAGIPFRIPEPSELAARLDGVLSAIYAAYAEGWVDAAGSDSRRRNLAGEAIWLGRLVTSLLPDEAEAPGLLSLMLFAEARRPARRDADGDYVPLGEQDMERWDHALIGEAEALLRRASSFGETGRFQLEAAVQSAHCARRYTGRTDWPAIRRLYDALSTLSASPVVAINRAVAVSNCDGPAAGLSELARIAGDPRLASYQPYWAALADLEGRCGNFEAAHAAFDRAIGLDTDQAVRTFLARRRAAMIH